MQKISLNGIWNMQGAGYACEGTVPGSVYSFLLDKGLIAEKGQLDAPGRPILFGTTDAFLRCFGLTTLADLPAAELPTPEQMAISAEDGQ